MPVGDVERAEAILVARGVSRERAGGELREMARRRHISLSRCAALVASTGRVRRSA
ncbi:hypothetical protein [Amycolatopsis sp. WAC 04197]|uniref:hypothetical protein n=1 Tax=Amycolatopsis sp. WAC 04197 TaxID=2203199 RepID=UPI0013153BC9|nr:hypothetical protein [Amycolatopsis sp. WAC 04197]